MGRMRSHLVDLEICMEKAMARHSSTLAWRIPGMGEPGGLPSMGSHRVRHLPHPIPLGHPSAPALSTLSHALNLDWRSRQVQF